jgi:hypothetical protein
MIMPRLAFEEPKGGPEMEKPTQRRREIKRDGVVVVLKAATFAIVIALIGAVVLLVTASGEEPAAKAPAVPEIKTSHLPSSGVPTSTTPLGAMFAPEVRSVTAQVVPTVAPPPELTVPTVPTIDKRPPGRHDRFAVIGAPCETRGEYSFTERYEPVVCGGQKPTQALVWNPIFR